MTDRIQILSCSPVAGNLYERLGEDGPLHCYDWSFIVRTVDGRSFVHARHAVRGALRSPEGFWVTNFQARTQATKFACRVEARGSIDARYWTEIADRGFDLERELAAEAEREQLERAGL